MGRPAGWLKELTGRNPMVSPGQPGTRRGIEREFWKHVAAGASSEDAAVTVGVSSAVGTRWFRQGGGMPTITLTEPSGRYLSFAEREEIALLNAQNHWVRDIARRLGRAPGTISRELRRNAATRGGPRPTKSVQAVAIPKTVPRAVPTTYRDKAKYRVYEIFQIGSGETWKFGITSATTPERRPEAQLAACRGAFGSCGWEWKTKTPVEGYYTARVIEYGYIMDYYLENGHCPPGQAVSCK